MKIRPGIGLTRAAAAIVCAGVACFFISAAIWLVPLLVIAAALLAVAEFFELKRSFANISIKCAAPARVARNSMFSLRIEIENKNIGPLEAEVRAVMPAEAEPRYWIEKLVLAPIDTTPVVVSVRVPIRGEYTFGPAWLRVTGRWRILDAQRVYETVSAVKVVPATAVPNEEIEKDALQEVRFLEKTKFTRQRGEGAEFESLSEYREGDDPRRIDWRSSARHRHLVVRKFQVEQHRDIVIIVDCGRLMGIAADDGTKLDRAVDSALMLSRIALNKGDRCGLGCFDDKVLGFLPPLAGARAFQSILDTVYNVKSRLRESNFNAMFALLQTRQVKRSMVIVLSDLADTETSDLFRSALGSLAKRHVVLFVALRTPLLSELTNASVDSMLDISRKAVVLRLLRAREAALHTLDHVGVHVLDVEPRQLTVALINRYVMLRQRNLL